MIAALDALAQRYPTLNEVIDSLRTLRQRTRREPRGMFFETKSLIDLSEPKPILLAVGESDLNAWRRHMSDGATVRMHALEDGAVAELVGGRMLSTMAIVRAHMEVAALATYCNEKLYQAGRERDFGPMNKLILATYFGSNLRIMVKGTPELDDYLRPEEIRPINPGEMIKAMDAFAGAGEKAGTRFQLVYSFLSEFAHPAMRATSTFADVLAEHPEGWYIQYRDEDKVDERSALMALEALLDNMRVGHAAAELLNLAGVVEDASGSLHLVPLSPDQFDDVWQNILQRPPED